MGGTGGFNREQFAKKIYSNFEYKNKNRDRDIKEDVKKEFKRIEDRDENLFVHYRDDQQIWDAGINIIDNYILQLKYSKGLRVDNEKFGIKDGKATLMKSENIYKNEALQYFTNARKKLREKYNATEGIKITSSDENRKLIHEVACDIDKAENEALKKIELKCNPKQEQQNAIEHSSVKKDKNGNVKVKTNNKGELEIVRQKPMFTQDNKGVLTFTDRSNQPKIHEALKGLFPKGKNYIYKINYKGCTNQNIKNKMMKLIGTGECYISYDEQTKTYLLRDKKGKPIQSRAIIWEGVTLRRDELIQWDTHEKEEERKENIGKIDASVQSDKAPEDDPELKDMIDDIPESLREKLKARGNEDYRRFIIETEKRLGEIIRDAKKYGYRLHSEPVTKLQISSGLMEVHFIHSETEFDVKVRENDDSKLKNTLGRGLYDFIDKHHESEYKTYLTKRINKLWNGKFSEIGLKDDLATEIKPNYNLEEDEKLPVETVKNLNYGIKILKKFIGNHRESEGDSWSDNDDRYLVSMEEEIENLEYTIQTRRDNTKNKDMLAIIDQSIDKLANSWGAYWSIHPEPEKTKIREVLFGDTKSNQIEALRKMAKGKRIFGDVTESSFLEDEISINGETVKTDKVVINPETGEPLLDEEGNPIKEMTIQGGLEVEDSEINEKFQNINELLYTDLHYNDNNKLIGSEKQRQIIDELYSASADTTGGGIISILIKENMIPQGWDTDDDVKEKCKDIAEALREKKKTIDGLSINDMKSNEQKEKRELEMKSHKTEEDLKRLQALIYLEEHPDEANEIHETSLKKMQDEIKYGEINDLIRSSLAPVFVDKGGGAKGKNADTYNDIVGYGFRNLSDENVKIAGEILAEIVITVVVAVCTAGIGGVAVAGVLRGASMLARSARWVKLANNISKAVKLLKTGARGWKYANAAGKTTQVLGKGAALLIEGTTFNAASTMIHSAINGTSLDGLNLNPIAKENIQTAAFLGALSIGNKLGMKVISKLHGKTKIEAFSKAGLKDVIKNHKGIRTESLVSEATAMFGAEQGMNFIFGHDVIDPKTGDIETSRSFQRPTQQEFIQMIGMILAFKAVKPQVWHKYEQKLNNGTLEICRSTKKNEILLRDPKTGKVEKIQDLIDGKGSKTPKQSPIKQKTENQELNNKREELTRKKENQGQRKSELERKRAELETRRQELLRQREANRRSLDGQGNGIEKITDILKQGNIITIDGLKYKFTGIKNGKAEFIIDKTAKKSAENSGKSFSEKVEVYSLEELLDSRFNLEPGKKNTNSGRYSKLNELVNNKVEPLDRLQNKIRNKQAEISTLEEEIARLEKGRNTTAKNDYFEQHKNEIVGRNVRIDGVKYRAEHINGDGAIQFKERDGNKNFTVSSFEQLAQKGQVNGFSDGLLSDGSPRKGSETLTSHERTNHETIRNLIDGERSYLEGRNVQETINQQKSRLEQAKQELRGLEDKVPASQARQNAINERAQKGREINKELGKIETELGKVGREIDNVERSISNRERELNELQESQPSEERASETPREQSRGEGEEPSKVEITDETLADEFDSQILNEGITINGDTYKLEYRENTTLNNNRKGEYVWTKNGKVIRKAKAETKTLPDNSNGNRIRSEYNRLREEYIHAKKGTKGTIDTNTGNERVEASSENNPELVESELVESELNQELSKLGNGGNYENVKLNWVTKKMFETGVFIEGVHRRFKNLSLKPNLKMPKEFLRKIRNKLIDMKNRRGKNLSEQYRKLVDRRDKYLEKKIAENGNEVEIKEDEIKELENGEKESQRNQKDKYFNGKSHEFDVTERQARKNSKEMDKITDKMDGKNEAKQIKKLKKEIAKQYKKATGKKIELTDEQVRSIIDAHKQEGTLGEVKQSELLNKDRTLAETIADKDLRRFLLEAGFCGKSNLHEGMNFTKFLEINPDIKVKIENGKFEFMGKNIEDLYKKGLDATLEGKSESKHESLIFDFNTRFSNSLEFLSDKEGSVKFLDSKTGKLVNGTITDYGKSLLGENFESSPTKKAFFDKLKSSMFYQHLDNPLKYCSHGADHSILVDRYVQNIIESYPDVVNSVKEKYGVSNEGAMQLLRLTAVFHDFGYPDIGGLAKAMHGPFGGAHFINKYASNSNSTFIDFIKNDLGITDQVKVDQLINDMRDAIFFHSADKVEKGYLNKITYTKGSFLLGSNLEAKGTNDFIEILNRESDGAMTITYRSEEGRTNAENFKKKLLEKYPNLDWNKINIEKDTNSYSYDSEFGSTTEYQGRKGKVGDTGIEFQPIDLLSDPLAGIVRLADNMDMSFDRLTKIQSHPIFMNLFYNIGYEYKLKNGETNTETASYIYQKMEKLNKLDEKLKDGEITQEKYNTDRNQIGLEVELLIKQANSHGGLEITIFDEKTGRPKEGNSKFRVPFKGDILKPDGKVDLYTYKQFIIDAMAKHEGIELNNPDIQTIQNIAIDNDIGSYSFRHFIGLTPIKDVTMKDEGGYKKMVVKVDKNIYLNPGLRSQKLTEGSFKNRPVVEYHIWRLFDASGRVQVNGDLLQVEILDMDGNRIGFAERDNATDRLDIEYTVNIPK